ncbi:RAMP superfamily CRISPR-associated protein [Argonema galeatum]|uniref:RAMP superfamily CRISPR-associated protein n=1 Tax=Argonema galeatum TaxID=2942762 RepID=UPI002011FD7F|nr:RAMP superfamily CRISPR-associated protein [Argonema galeatum]MCL1466536.1 RAMP superfamily CRISPR-associated protein [Argonema galeatum A003/A1]
MTRNLPPKPKGLTSPRRPVSSDDSDGTSVSKPYELISFPKEGQTLQHPAGHHKYHSDRVHGTLFLKLKVGTSLHVSTGVVVMGSDIGSRLPLIKTMTQGTDQKLAIQGSSLKGCIRSVYEAITNSRLGVITNKREYKDKYPLDRLPCEKKDELCPASQVFGALNWQGLIEFSDAKCESAGFATGFMPNLWSPRLVRRAYFDERGKVAGRKFYYHTIRAIDKGQNAGVAVQQAAKTYTFTTQLHFKNLKPAELGTLLIVLGQDPKYPIALKVGGGKPIGMGTMTVEVTKIIAFTDSQELVKELKLPGLRDRYSSYTPPESATLTGNDLQQLMQKTIQAAHSSLVQATQLQQLAEVLRYPTDREPPTGMY